MKTITRLTMIVTVAFLADMAARPQGTPPQRDQTQRPDFAAFQQTKQWQDYARRFNKNKASAASILLKADRVEVYRLFEIGREKPKGKLLDDFPFYARAKEQSRPFAARLAATVLDPRSYLLPGQTTKQCLFDPGVGFRVWRGKRFVDVLLCFHCSELVVLENHRKRPESSLGGWVVGDFDPARARLAGLAKEALPDSPEIQRL